MASKTLTGSLALSGGLTFSGTDHAGVRVVSLTTTQRDALTPAAGDIIWNSTLSKFQWYTGSAWKSVGDDSFSIVLDVTGVDGAVFVGTDLARIRVPRAFTLTEVRASLTTGGVGGGDMTIDINKNGTSVLSTKLTIDDDGDTTSVGADSSPVISTSSFADDDIVTIDVDAIGGGGTGLVVVLIGT